MKEAQSILGANGRGEGATRVLCIAVVPKARAASFPLYWLQMGSANGLSDEQINDLLTEVLTDPLQEELWICEPYNRNEWIKKWHALGYRYWAEKQFVFGVTDNLAHTVEEALRLLGFPPSIHVASGRGYLFKSAEASQSAQLSKEKEAFANKSDIDKYALYRLYHPVVENWSVHDLSDTNPSELFAFPAVQMSAPSRVATVSLEIPDSDLADLSKDRLLALTLDEMKAIRLYFRKPSTEKLRRDMGLPENPTDVELEVIAQTWSEHCKHKIFNASITHTDPHAGPGKQKQVIHSLYRTYIQGPTKELMATRKDLLSVFKDNSGVVRWDDKNAICFKVETHNSPSALEPYGGALTGILGVNRDILGTGLGAKPIFNTDVFCFAYPHSSLPQRPKLLPAKTILDGVRKGVEDGGNKSGIPTINGAIFFDKNYRAKPLVFCGTGGILPLTINGLKAYEKHTQVGDTIVMAGGRVGKDGVHGATFSSESLHEGSPISAVQIGDPFTQKRLTDFVIEARDAGLITGITDNGAGGLSSSVGEMAQQTGGATMELDNVPTKYPGLADWEIVVSESQERMTLATKNFPSLKELAAKHNVEVTAIGKFDNKGLFTIQRSGKSICALELSFLHDGCPTLELESEWQSSQITMTTGSMPPDLNTILLSLLAHPNICSREAIIRQYDHEVKGQSVIKPLMGVKQVAPCDAAVIAPIYGDNAGLVVSNGLNPRLTAHDPHLMAVCAVDEAVRNAVCVGADPATLSLLDNFCWPDPVTSITNPHGKTKLAQLVRTCIGLKEAVLAFRAPLISGKDSMKNDFDDGVLRLSIPPTLLISAIGRVHNIDECVSMEFKQPGDLIYLLRGGVIGLAASHYEELSGWQSPLVPSIDLSKAALLYGKLHEAIRAGLVQSAHDLSEGGLAVATAECIIGGGFGATLSGEQLVQAMQTPNGKMLPVYMQTISNRLDTIIFGEGPAHIIVSIKPEDQERWQSLWQDFNCTCIGEVTAETNLRITHPAKDEKGREIDPNKKAIELDMEQLERAWKKELPFD
jgi:phosphoribosylformylglycinamidine synthase subunit PurSL